MLLKMEGFRFFCLNISTNGSWLAYIAFLAMVLLYVPTDCSAESGCSRKLGTTILCPSLNHSCSTENGTVVNLVHTEAVGLKDTIHYVYSTWGIPSVLIAKTSLKAKLTVDYDKFINNSVETSEHCINFTEKPENIFVVMLSEVIDFIDNSDSAVIGNSSQTPYNLSMSQWNHVEVHNEHPEHHFIEFRTSNGSHFPPVKPTGFIAITFRAMCDDGYYSELPNLQYNSNMSLVDVVLNNIHIRNNKSRLAIKMIVASQGNSSTNMTIQKHKSIDDEHSPGSFLTINWLTGTTPGGFLQWKPTCYNKPVRNLQSLSSSHYTEPVPYSFEKENMPRSLAFDYFGNSIQKVDHVKIAYTDISFGLPADGFYRSTYFDAWSFSFGFGVPPSDKISLGIIFIIAVGLGIPVLLTIGGAVYICIRRYRHREGYEEITGSYSEIN